ncbi:hypothetical protein [Nostoc sp.]|uniref:hypothetical protein n=1 Tax=Nostoc sp. TaxID=1180 RepID=UPI002FF71D1E
MTNTSASLRDAVRVRSVQVTNTSLPEAALLYETLRVACFHEVVRQGSVTTPTASLRDAVRVRSV